MEQSKKGKNKIKSVKSFLNLCLMLSDADRDELKGIEKLSQEEYYKLGEVRAGIQNDLGEMADLLAKHKLKK